MAQYNVPDKNTGDKWSADEHNQMKEALNSKQDALVSGENIGTVNGQDLTTGDDVAIPAGKSAYEIAVDNGYEGTEAQFVDDMLLNVAKLLSFLSVNGTVIPTQDGGKIRFDMNWDGTINGAPVLTTATGYTKEEQDATTQFLLNKIAEGPDFDPTSIDGLSLWLDASDVTTITLNSGGGGSATVSEWRDKSGNGNHAVAASPGLQPTYSSTGGPNNNGAMVFDGLTQGLHIPAFDMVDTQDITRFIVLRSTEPGTRVIMEQTGNYNADPNGFITYGEAGGNQIYNAHNGNSAISSGYNILTPNTFGILQANNYKSLESGEALLLVNNSQENYVPGADSANTDSFTFPAPLYIGCRDNNSLFFAGSICDIMVFNRILTNTEKTNILLLLKSKNAL